jgi:hypothetical protein
MCISEKANKRRRTEVLNNKQLRSNSDALIAAIAQYYLVSLKSMGLKLPKQTTMSEHRAATTLRFDLQPAVRGDRTARATQACALDLVAHAAMRQQRTCIEGMLGLQIGPGHDQVLGSWRSATCAWQ